jgi:hypothetical protein
MTALTERCRGEAAARGRRGGERTDDHQHPRSRSGAASIAPLLNAVTRVPLGLAIGPNQLHRMTRTSLLVCTRSLGFPTTNLDILVVEPAL